MINTKLKNGTEVKIINSPKTPRTAVTIFLPFQKLERRAGIMSLINRLLLQGTTKRSAEKLAAELDENAIELYTELKNDYLRIRILALNDDFEHALEITEDIIKNSTFENFKKEVEKLRGELTAELDTAKIKAQDDYYKTIFRNHPYGIGFTTILENLDNITKEDVKSKYRELLKTSKKNISVVGDIENTDKIKQMLEKHFGDMENNSEYIYEEDIYTLAEERISTVVKEDANQAQIYKGWIFPPINTKDYPKFMLLNTILGSGGMTSRLFYELREKQGLAYVVRSTLDANKLACCFTVYIATEPKNIQTSLKGFETEIEKIKNVLLSDEELENAKNNLIGRRQFYYETNLLKATMTGVQSLYNSGDDYEEKLVKEVETITKEELRECAEKYFSAPSALSVLAPSKFLEEAGLK